MRPDIATCAMRRYRGEPLIMALMYFESDRRTAGLGALDPKRRGSKGEVRNTKWLSLMDDVVRYDLVVDRHERWEYPPMEIDDYVIGSAQDSGAFVTATVVPARRVARCVSIHLRELRTQRGRDNVARLLREARRQRAEATS